MATTPSPPDAPAPETAPASPAAPPSTAGVYEYVDETPRTYQFDGAPPQSARKGDVCDLPCDPGDGRWQPTKKKVTRLPDNDPEQAAKTAKAQAEERANVLAEAAKRERDEAIAREQAAAAGTGA